MPDNKTNARENVRYIWKCNQKLVQAADQALDSFAKAPGTPASDLEVAVKIGFLSRLKTQRIEAFPFAKQASGQYFYTLTKDKEKIFGDAIRPASGAAPTAYIDAQGFTYLPCRYKEEKTLYIQVDRETAIDFLFKQLGLPIREDPGCAPEAADQKLEEGISKIKNYLRQ